MPDEADPGRLDEFPVRVVGRVQALCRAFALLGGVARARFTARDGRVGVLGRGEQEVDRVLGAVVEGATVALRGHALFFVGSLPERVALALALRVEREHDIAGLGQRLGLVPVELFVGLHRAVGDHDAGTFLGAGDGRPHATGQRRTVARGEQDGLGDAVVVGDPVVQADVAGTPVLAVPADVVGEEAARVGGLLLQGFGVARRAVGRELRLVFGRVVDRLALLR